jgi:hypothetical protein
MSRFRHQVVWGLLRFPVYAFLKLKFNFVCEKVPRIPGPFILISNHVTNYDPLMVGCRFSQQMYFVASEHLFRKGFVTKLLVWLVAPIAKVKGSTDTVSALTIMRALKYKSNVGLFAEGDRSWNGLTGPLHPTTARLIKASKATLVTYRLTGGYLTSPRWSALLRRGRMHGRCVNIYSPAALSDMSVSGITDAINADIYEDAYQTQCSERIAYRGRDLALGLENALYTCPVCRGVCTTSSQGDSFFCSCGLRVKYNEYGFFEGLNRPFDTVTEWDAWQEKFLLAYVSDIGDKPIYTDSGQSLIQIGVDHTESFMTAGTMMLYKDRLTIGCFSVPLSKLYQMSIYGAANIVFSAEGVNYEIRSAIRRSGRKYLTMYELLTNAALNSENSTAHIST